MLKLSPTPISAYYKDLSDLSNRQKLLVTFIILVVKDKTAVYNVDMKGKSRIK